MITSPNSIMSDFGGGKAKRTWKPKTTSSSEQLPSLFASSISKSSPVKKNATNVAKPPSPVAKTVAEPVNRSPSKPVSQRLNIVKAPSATEETVPSLFKSALSPAKPASFKAVKKTVEEPPTTPTKPTSTTESRKAGRAAANKNVKKKSATMPARRSKAVNDTVAAMKTPTNSSKPSVSTSFEYSPAGSYAFSKLQSTSVKPKKTTSPKKSPSLPTSPQRQYLGSPRPKSPQKNSKIVSVFHKGSPRTPSNDNDEQNNSSTPSLANAALLSPEQQHALMASLPMFMYKTEPSPLIDVDKTQNVLDRLRQAEYDNDSCSSEVEAIERAERSGKGKSKENEIKEKLSHFFSNHSISSSESDDDVSVSVSSTGSEESGLFRY